MYAYVELPYIGANAPLTSHGLHQGATSSFAEIPRTTQNIATVLSRPQELVGKTLWLKEDTTPFHHRTWKLTGTDRTQMASLHGARRFRVGC